MGYWASKIAVVLLAAHGPTQVVSWEGTSFPDGQGWERITNCTPERAIEDGWLIQDVQSGECGPPPTGDLDAYTRSVSEFEGESRFFLEWRLRAEGDRSEIPWGAPAVFSAWSRGPVGYTFFIARDQVKFTQDGFHLILFVDIEPGVPHTFRLELFGDEAYRLFIDGGLVLFGVPGGAYPMDVPSITWGAQSAFLENHVEWDYIRYGVIPEDGSGDFDSDEDVDEDDYYFFHECLAASGPKVDAGPGCRFADFDFDTDVDLEDFVVFQERFTESQ